MICPICNTDAAPITQKLGIQYAKCSDCGTVFTTDNITSAIATENDLDEPRNWHWINKERIARVNEAFGQPVRKALDFGCGNGQLVGLMIAKGAMAYGIDKDTSLNIDTTHGPYDAITMVEVIEHLSSPKTVLQKLADKLGPDGILYIETTFADNLPHISAASYVDPSIGHITILSMDALRRISPSGTSRPHIINPNAVYFKKLSS